MVASFQKNLEVYMRYNKESGHFVPGGRKTPNKVQVTVRVDEKNLNILRDMPQAPKRQRGSMCQTRGCTCTESSWGTPGLVCAALALT